MTRSCLMPQWTLTCSVSLRKSQLLVSAQAADEDEEASGEQSALVTAKVGAVAAIGRLVAFGVVPQAAWLGPALLSHFVAHGKAVADAVKDVIRYCGPIATTFLHKLLCVCERSPSGSAPDISYGTTRQTCYEQTNLFKVTLQRLETYVFSVES